MVNANNISRDKLNSRDHYRNQVQFTNMEDKILYATVYNFLADKHSDNAKIVRDFTASQTISKLREVFKVMKNTKPANVLDTQFVKWLEENIPDKDLLKEITGILRKKSIL